MSRAASEFFICVIIVWTLVSLAKCGRCPLNNEVQKRVDHDHDACSSHMGSYNPLQNTFGSYFDVDAATGHHRLALPVTKSEDTCISSESGHFPSALYVFHSEAQCSSTTGSLDVNGSGYRAALSTQSSSWKKGNGSWSSDPRRFSLPNGGTVTCSLDYRKLTDEIPVPGVNSAGQTMLSSCKSHLLYQQSGFSSKDIEIGKRLSLDSSSPRVNIIPSRLDWGQTYLYHPSVASLRLKNTCNETALKVYLPFSTDTQFYPFNFSELVLGPGEVATISFVFLPKWLGSSSAELVLQTSFGGFLLEAKGFAVESPYRLSPLTGLDISSGGWLSRKFSLWNPFDETIHVEEVTTWFSLVEDNSPFLAEVVCSKHNSQDPNECKHGLSKMNEVPSVESKRFDSVVMAVQPLGNWVIGARTTESILEMAFSSDSEGPVFGAICIQLVRPLDGKKDTFVVPFEAELNKTTGWAETVAPLSVSIDVVGHFGANETSVSISLRNSALHLLKFVSMGEVFGSKRLLQIKSYGELLLFPGTITQVALVTCESSNANYESLLEMADVSKGCMLQILTNDTTSPALQVSCQEILGICSRKQQGCPSSQINSVDSSNRRSGYLASAESSSSLIKALVGAEVDEHILQNWRDQRTTSGLNLLNDHELLFPMVPIGGHLAKSITVRNPSQQPVLVQLIVNSEEIIENCKDHHGHLQPPLSNSLIQNHSTIPSRHGFSVPDSAVKEAYLHPHGTVSLGPILFHPSNRCEWKTSALIRNNISGVEWLSLSGFGGSLSLVLLEGSEHVDRLDFDLNTPPPLNMSSPDPASSSSIQDASSACHNTITKKLFAVNAGDFSIKVKSIHVSGTECGLDGFSVHNCKSFSLEPGESVELGISYQTDFFAPLVQRDLELTLAAGVVVIPMKASVPLHMLNFCRKSIFWARVRKACVFIILATVLATLLIWLSVTQNQAPTPPSCSVDYFPPGKKSSAHHTVNPRGSKSSTPTANLGKKTATSTKPAKPVMVAEKTDPSANGETGFQPCVPPEQDVVADSIGKFEVTQTISLSVKTHKERRRRQRKKRGTGSGLMSVTEVSSSQSGNSTPSSPMSPMIITGGFSLKETCSSSSSSPVASNPFVCDTEDSDNKLREEHESGLIRANVSGKHTGNPTKPVLLPSATFPGTGRSHVSIPGPTPSRLAGPPHARAPGPKSQKAVQPEEQTKLEEDRFAYNIWGNHFSGLDLMTCVKNDQSAVVSSRATTVEGDSDSFFLRGPKQTLFTNCRSKSFVK